MQLTLNKAKLISEVQSCLMLAAPLAGAQLAQAATAFVDTIMMGLLGSNALAAGGLGASVFQSLLLIVTGIVAAVSPIVASAYGSGNIGVIGKTVRQGLWLAAALSVPLAGLLWSAGTWLPLVGQNPETVQSTMLYLHAIVWGVLPALGFAVLRNFVASLSETRPIIVTMIGGTVLNVVGNYTLALGKLGLPALGLAGIGWASTLSLWAMFFALLIYILRRPHYQVYRLFQGLTQFDRAVLQELLYVGLPIGALLAVETGMFTVTMLMMGTLGTTALAAHQIAIQTASITFMVPLGVALATTIRVGQQLGQQNPAGARLSGLVGIGLAGVFMSGMGLLFWLFPEKIVGIYLDLQDPANTAVINQSKQFLRVAAVFQIVDGIQVAATGALRGLKDTRIPMLIGLLAYWGIGLTSGYGLGIYLHWGGVGLWWGLAIGLTVAAMVLTWRFYTTPIAQPVRHQDCAPR
jgi:multidrug resistance protein, MATE family